MFQIFFLNVEESNLVSNITRFPLKKTYLQKLSYWASWFNEKGQRWLII